MAQGLFPLLLMSTVMAIASFAAGMLPLVFTLSPKRLRFISTMGVGILVGTSLIIIIPEGFETLYKANHHDTLVPRNMNHLLYRDHTHAQHYEFPSQNSHDLLDTLQDRIQRRQPTISRDPQDSSMIKEITEDTSPSADGAEGLRPATEVPSFDPHPKEDEYVDQPHVHGTQEGFIFMFLVDQLPQIRRTSNHQYSYSTISVDTLRSFSDGVEITDTQSSHSRAFSTTFGMIIHAAADGIALGASSTSSNTTLELIVFFAIMIHKAPTAFGFIAILLRQGLSKRQARSHLIAFSAAAPIGAVLTWMCVKLAVNHSSQSSQADVMNWWTGIFLLFSGGTFLYVAMHAMQEESHQISNHSSYAMNNISMGGTGSDNSDTDNSKGKNELQDMFVTILGMLLPLLAQIGHHH